MRASAGLHGGDALVGQHRVSPEEVGVLGRVDVVGEHGDREFLAELAAEGRDESGLARADRPADTDAERLTRLAMAARTIVVVTVGLPVDEMRWHGDPFG